jgi:hypothetical protein
MTQQRPSGSPERRAFFRYSITSRSGSSPSSWGGDADHLRSSVMHRYLSGWSRFRAAGLAADAQLRLGAGTVHHHVRLDGQVRRRLRRAHRHPRRRRRADQPPERRTRGKFIVFGLLPAPCSPASSARSARTSSGRTAPTTRCQACSAWNWAGSSKARPRPTSSGRPGSSTAPFRSVRA